MLGYQWYGGEIVRLLDWQRDDLQAKKAEAKIIDLIAKYVGVSYPPALALTLTIAVLVVKILSMDIDRSRIEIRNQRLIQKVAILEADLKNLSKQAHNVPED
jgi:hypothetical protein